ncbi:hypothetical protein KI387_029749, partial [Taxus chinensis]
NSSELAAAVSGGTNSPASSSIHINDKRRTSHIQNRAEYLSLSNKSGQGNDGKTDYGVAINNKGRHSGNQN